MRRAVLLAALSVTWACDQRKQAAAPPVPLEVAKAAPAAPARKAPGASVAPTAPAAGSASASVPATEMSSTPAIAAGPKAATTPAPEPPATPHVPGMGGAGTGRDIEEMFPDRIEALSQGEPLSGARKSVLLNQVRRRHDAPVTLRHIIASPDHAGQQEVYALYEYPRYHRCTSEAPPETCPSPEEVALNPACRGHGLVHATFPDAEQADGEGDGLQLMPLAEAGCELELRHWFVARVDDDAQLDAYLEVVSSRVASKEPGRKRPQVTLEHRQLLYLWSGEASDEEADAEPSLFLDLGTWTVEQWRQREPPVRESIVLFKGLYSAMGNRTLDFVQLLPCLDPWSDKACDPELRQRTIHSWGKPASE